MFADCNRHRSYGRLHRLWFETVLNEVTPAVSTILQIVALAGGKTASTSLPTKIAADVAAVNKHFMPTGLQRRTPAPRPASKPTLPQDSPSSTLTWQPAYSALRKWRLGHADQANRTRRVDRRRCSDRGRVGSCRRSKDGRADFHAYRVGYRRFLQQNPYRQNRQRESGRLYREAPDSHSQRFRATRFVRIREVILRACSSQRVSG